MTDAIPLIHNPASGGGRGIGRLDEAKRAFRARGVAIEPIGTEAPGHAADLARALCDDGHDTIYILGGDGTLSEACNGVLSGGHRPTLGMIPAGTGNAFLDEFSLHSIDDAVDRIVADTPRAIDAATLTYQHDGETYRRHWINIFGAGFAPQAAEAANRHYKWAKDRAYDLGVLHRVIGLRHVPWTVELDGVDHSGEYSLVMVCNSIHTGKGMKMAPDAKPDDGLFDVVMAKRMSRMAMLGMLTKVQSGKHVEHPSVEVHRAKKVHIAPSQPSPLLVDGEVLGRTPVDLQILPGALRILL